MACCWEWVKCPKSTGGCGLCAGRDHNIVEGDGDGGIGEERLAIVGTQLGDGHDGVGDEG
jgi:hypothetical protein